MFSGKMGDIARDIIEHTSHVRSEITLPLTALQPPRSHTIPTITPQAVYLVRGAAKPERAAEQAYDVMKRGITPHSSSDYVSFDKDHLVYALLPKSKWHTFENRNILTITNIDFINIVIPKTKGKIHSYYSDGYIRPETRRSRDQPWMKIKPQEIQSSELYIRHHDGNIYLHKGYARISDNSAIEYKNKWWLSSIANQHTASLHKNSILQNIENEVEKTMRARKRARTQDHIFQSNPTSNAHTKSAPAFIPAIPYPAQPNAGRMTHRPAAPLPDQTVKISSSSQDLMNPTPEELSLQKQLAKDLFGLDI